MDDQINQLKQQLRSVRQRREEAKIAHHQSVAEQQRSITSLRQRISERIKRGNGKQYYRSVLYNDQERAQMPPHLILAKQILLLRCSHHCEVLKNHIDLVTDQDHQLSNYMKCERLVMEQEKGHVEQQLSERRHGITLRQNKMAEGYLKVIFHQRSVLGIMKTILAQDKGGSTWSLFQKNSFTPMISTIFGSSTGARVRRGVVGTAA